jgi:UDP-2,3-diacylglucosamine pyrophosphatase LpxH
MKEKVFVIGDIEMGRGDIMDDFSDDTVLAGFLGRITGDNPGIPLTLVLNGDIFDFLKMAYKGAYPRHITEDVSAWKLDEVLRSHPDVFTALKTFLGHQGNRVHFVIGNHDADLAWPALQNTLRTHLGGTESNVTFDFWFRKSGLHVEHGNLCDPFFSFKVPRALTTYRGKKILNTPFGANICFSYLVDLKRRFPLEEQLFPKHIAFSANPELKRQKKKLAKKILFKDLILYPLLKFRDPTRRAPYKKLFSHFLRFGTEVIDDSKFLPRTIRKMVRNNPEAELYVVGHLHLLGQHKYKDKTVFITDTWRDEYDLNKNMAKKPKSYAEISYDRSRITDSKIKVL